MRAPRKAPIFGATSALWARLLPPRSSSTSWRRALKASVFGLGAVALGACELGDASPGVRPPDDQLFFPQGLMLDPRVSAEAGEVCESSDSCEAEQVCSAGRCREPSRWLIVANANSDLTFNAGALIPFDLGALFDALDDPTQIGAPGSTTRASRPCRRTDLQPNLVECDEAYFAASDASVHFGDFAAQPASWDCEVLETSPASAPGQERPVRRVRYCDADEAMLLTPINGDPSITYTYLSGGLGGDDDVRLECGQGEGSGQVDPRRCADDFRLRYYRNDSDLLALPRELTTFELARDRTMPWGFGTHRARSAMSLLKLDGLRGGRDAGDFADPIGPIPDVAEMSSERPRPAFVDFQSVFAEGVAGGFGLSERPCDRDNPPAQSNNCSRPLMYAGFRADAIIAQVTASLVEPSSLTADQACLEGEGLPGSGEVDCDPKLLTVGSAGPGGLNLGFGGVLYGDIAFSASGDELFVVQSVPGALIRVNTGLDASGETIDEPNAFVEICDRPSALTIYENGGVRYGLTSCYRSALIYVVDLDSMTVVRQIRAGTGPNKIIPDLAREVVYVANTLDATISVIDMSRERGTRFTEVARLGLQEPFDP